MQPWVKPSSWEGSIRIATDGLGAQRARKIQTCIGLNLEFLGIGFGTPVILALPFWCFCRLRLENLFGNDALDGWWDEYTSLNQQYYPS